MNLAIVGTGYVGLTTGALFADRGNHVICVDTNKKIIEQLNVGEVHFHEDGLEGIVRSDIKRGLITFTDDLQSAVQKSKVTFIAVGTPGDNGQFNLEYVRAAAQEIGRALRGSKEFHVVVGKSTVPQGTYRLIEEAISEGLGSKKANWAYVSNPETLAEGSAVRDFSKPGRVIIGTNSDEAYKIMEELYHPFVRKEGRIIRGSPQDAEIAKLAANSLLASRIATINEIARIADNTKGADMEVIRGMVCSDKRIGFEFSFPGPGYGGSCFPKDVQGLVNQSTRDGYSPCLLDRVHVSNEEHKQYFAKKIIQLLDRRLDTTIGVWGTTFKPNTDDMRDAPSKIILPTLVEAGIRCLVYEPCDAKARKDFASFSDKISFVDDQYKAIQGADALVLLTEWSQFDAPDYSLLLQGMRGRQIFDLRNRWQPEVANKAGFDYFGVGRNYPLKK